MDRVMTGIQKKDKTILSNTAGLFIGVWSKILIVISRNTKLAILILNYHNIRSAVGWDKIGIAVKAVLLMIIVHALIEIPLRQKLEVYNLRRYYSNAEGRRYERLNSTAKLNIDKIERDGNVNSKLTFSNMIVNMKRDMWILIFGTLTFPVLPTIYMIMYTIPLQRRIYPNDTEVDLSYRASFPYKQGNKAYSRGLIYLVMELAIGVLMYKIGVSVYHKVALNPIAWSTGLDTGMAIAITVMFVATMIQSVIYDEFIFSIIKDMLNNTPTEKAVIDNRNKPRSQTPLVREFKRTASRMKDGFK